MILDFYGMKLFSRENGILQKGQHYSERFEYLIK